MYRKYKIKVATWWDQEGRVACKVGIVLVSTHSAFIGLQAGVH